MLTNANVLRVVEKTPGRGIMEDLRSFEYRKRLQELKANLLSLISLGAEPSTRYYSGSVLIGESSPKAKYSDNDLVHCIDLRLSGLSLRAISEKMDIPVRTLRDVFFWQTAGSHAHTFQMSRRI